MTSSISRIEIDEVISSCSTNGPDSMVAIFSSFLFLRISSSCSLLSLSNLCDSSFSHFLELCFFLLFNFLFYFFLLLLSLFLFFLFLFLFFSFYVQFQLFFLHAILLFVFFPTRSSFSLPYLEWLSS